jgi:hypothetical protein
MLLLSVVMLKSLMLSLVMLKSLMLSLVMLSVVMLGVIMLNVMVPYYHLGSDIFYMELEIFIVRTINLEKFEETVFTLVKFLLTKYIKITDILPPLIGKCELQLKRKISVINKMK